MEDSQTGTGRNSEAPAENSVEVEREDWMRGQQHCCLLWLEWW